MTLGRRSILEPEAELIVVTATPKQTWGRAPLLRLVPSESDGRPHYRIAYGDPDRNFLLSKRDGTWALRLRKHLKSTEVLEKQLELEARFVAPEMGKRRNRRHVDLDVPAPLRLYVSVRIAPPKR
ncbi:jg20136 [Pararge aegeria aegeria]|uniref:Jg20135 protein n=1 Tax=Pararge aegeria aegeria TaxID=348720 RepID=A0A8S4SDX0_9NEOP|nr:jg20135 [Pararge aegeria aegeria]CAH2261488.1 jg20136 [Pararge aegeria aegeria]